MNNFALKLFYISLVREAGSIATICLFDLPKLNALATQSKFAMNKSVNRVSSEERLKTIKLHFECVTRTLICMLYCVV